MGKINVLGFEIANLIAAGEVVDRPASVVKELLENALDAGASRISVEIRNGGVSLIRVTDDGSGISPEDMPVAIRRHATSKISEAADLAAIMTLGFRGEALAAIASVSKLTILSRTEEAEFGTMLVSDCGKVEEISEVGCAKGTAVIVENLFGNVPARRKFLKKDVTEAAAVSASVEKIAISRPEIAFRLVIDGNEKFATAGDGDLKNAIYAILGREFAMRLLPVSGEANGIAVSGYVGRSDNARGNRNAQNFFINGRYIRSKTVTAALERAYHSYLAPEKFPVSVLFLSCNPAFVDVNVHPAKLEVRFSNEQAVFEAGYYSVRAAIEAGGSRPEISLAEKTRQTSYAVEATPIGGEAPSYRIPSPSVGRSPRGAAPASGAESREYRAVSSAVREASLSRPSVASPRRSEDALAAIAEARAKYAPSAPLRVAEGIMPRQDAIPNPAELMGSDAPTYRISGTLFDTYILVEMGEEALLIDQHAAHERIIFEDLCETRRRDGRCLSQPMLLPLELSLSDGETAAAREYEALLSEIGFAFSFAESGKISLSAIPDSVEIKDAEVLFAKMCEGLADGLGDPRLTMETLRERALYQVACKAAVKGGRRYDRAHLEWIAERIVKNPEITVCPHGRPIAVKLTKSELDRRFDRIK